MMCFALVVRSLKVFVTLISLNSDSIEGKGHTGFSRTNANSQQLNTNVGSNSTHLHTSEPAATF